MLLKDNEFMDLLHSEVKAAIKEAITEMGIPLGRSSNHSPQSRYLTRRQVSDYLGIGLSTVDYWTKLDKLHKIFIDGAPRFDREEIDKSFSDLKKFKRAV